MPLEHSSKSFAPASLTFTLKVKYRSSQRMFLLRSSSFSSQHCYLSLLPLFKWPSSTISSSLVSRTSSSIISSYQYARLCIPPSFLSSCLFPRSPPSIVSYFLLSTPFLPLSITPASSLPATIILCLPGFVAHVSISLCNSDELTESEWHLPSNGHLFLMVASSPLLLLLRRLYCLLGSSELLMLPLTAISNCQHLLSLCYHPASCAPPGLRWRA